MRTARQLSSAHLAAMVVIVGVVGAPRAGWGDGYHYNSELLGGRAGGMGGAVVGMPEDEACAYYNPAAFVRAGLVSLSVSATALDVQSQTYLSYLGSPATASSAGIIPNSSVASSPWHGGRISFSVFTTNSSQLELNRTFQPPSTSGLSEATLSQNQTYSTYLLGPSVGVPLTNEVSVGISAFFVYGSSSLSQRVYQVEPSLTGPSTVYERQVSSNEISTGLIVVAGLQYQPGGPAGRFTLGLVIRSGASLADSAANQEQDFQGTLAPDGGTQLNATSTSGTTQGQEGIPSQVAGGLSLRLGPGRLSGDVTVSSAVAPDKQLVINGAAGYEWSLGTGWVGRAGFYTDRSSAPTAITQTVPHVDNYGATLGLGQVVPHHTVDVALKYAYATGEAEVEALHGTFDSTAVRGYEVTLTIGGSFRL